MVAITITRPLVQRFGPPTLAGPVDWHGGSGFRFPGSLWVSLDLSKIYGHGAAVSSERISRARG
jgi:hypothetical protein